MIAEKIARRPAQPSAPAKVKKSTEKQFNGEWNVRDQNFDWWILYNVRKPDRWWQNHRNQGSECGWISQLGVGYLTKKLKNE